MRGSGIRYGGRGTKERWGLREGIRWRGKGGEGGIKTRDGVGEAGKLKGNAGGKGEAGDKRGWERRRGKED